MVRIAILSDLHIEYNDSIQGSILDKIINHFEELKLKGKNIDLVLVPGDITFNGRREEFDTALNFFQMFQHSLDLPSDRFIITPGNHDYNRELLETDFKYINKIDSEIYKEILSSKKFNNHIDEAFRDYILFMEKFNGEKPSLINFSKIIELEDFVVNISCINSCLVNTIGQDKLQPFIYIDRTSSCFKNKYKFDLSVLVQHHPPFYLYPDNRRDIEKNIAESYDLVIAGHEHHPDYKKIGGLGEDECLLFICGCTYLSEHQNPEKYFYRFSIIDYDPNLGKVLHSHFCTRKNLNYCANDTHVCLEARNDGTVTLTLAGRKYDENVSEIKDPLAKYELSHVLSEFFNKEHNKILKAKSKEEIYKLRKGIESPHILSINELSFYFLKYLIEEKIVDDYDSLNRTLNEVTLFRYISRFHNVIRKYYGPEYFKKEKYSIIDFLSRRKKDINIKKVLEELERKDRKIEELTRKTNSIIEIYKNRPVELMPPLPQESVESVEEHFDWFLRLNLKDNPFPSLEGLNKIDLTYYDQVIYPSWTIRQFQKTILNNFSILTEITMCIHGPLGSGKTTLFQYIQRLINMHRKDTIAIIFPLDARENLREIKRKFFLKLSSYLRKIHQQEIGYNQEEKDPEEDCLKMLRNLSTVKTALFIFIEDIYKHSSLGEYMEEVIGFIKSLQIYRKDFSEEIKTSFFFSAIEEVVKRIQGDRTTSGSVDDYYKMSAITIDEAYEMINQRLRAFAINPDNPPKITREYLVRLRNMEHHPGRPIKTFRDYIEILVPRFKRLEFTEDSITIKNNDVEIQNALTDIQRSHTNLYNALIELKRRTKSNIETFEKFIKILEDLWLGEPIEEESYQFLKIREYLIHLSTINLLQKAKSSGKPKWTISEECNLYFNKISNIYRVHPINIIPYLIFTEELPISLDDEVSLAMQNIIKRGEEYGANFLNSLISAAKDYKMVYQFSKSIQIADDQSINEFNIDLIENSLHSLLTAFVIQCDAESTNLREVLDYHENSWYEIQEATTFVRILKDYKLNINPSVEEKMRLISEFLDTSKIIVSTLKRFVQWDNWFSLKNRTLWNSDKRILNDIRRNVESNNFRKAYFKITGLLKEKMERFIFDYTRILFGNNKWKRGIPEDINLKFDHISKFIPSVKYVEKELLANLNVFELFSIINYMNIEKVGKKIEFLNKIDDLCQKINLKLVQESGSSNPWTMEILGLVEEFSTFYERLFKGAIPCPWNSHVLQSVQDVKIYALDDFIDKFHKLLIERLVLDKDLRIKHYTEESISFLELIFSITSNIENIHVTFDYKREEIQIIKRSEKDM